MTQLREWNIFVVILWLAYILVRIEGYQILIKICNTKVYNNWKLKSNLFGTNGRQDRGESYIDNSHNRSKKSTTIKQLKAARILRDELSDIICSRDIKAFSYPDDNLLQRTSVVDVDICKDYSFAKIGISVAGNSVERRRTFVWICENTPQIRHSLSQRLRHLKRLPALRFDLVDTLKESRMQQTISEIERQTSEFFERIRNEIEAGNQQKGNADAHDDGGGEEDDDDVQPE